MEDSQPNIFKGVFALKLVLSVRRGFQSYLIVEADKAKLWLHGSREDGTKLYFTPQT